MTDSSAAPPPDSPAHGTQLPGPCARGAAPRCCCPSTRCWGRGTPQPPQQLSQPSRTRSARTELPWAECCPAPLLPSGRASLGGGHLPHAAASLPMGNRWVHGKHGCQRSLWHKQDLGWKRRRTALPKSQALPAPARGCLRGAGTWRELPKCHGLAAPASAPQTAPLRSPAPGAGCPWPQAPLWHHRAGTCMRFVTCLPPLHPRAAPTTRCSSTFVLRPLLTAQSQD